jgi:hypothetical protein
MAGLSTGYRFCSLRRTKAVYIFYINASVLRVKIGLSFPPIRVKTKTEDL